MDNCIVAGGGAVIISPLLEQSETKIRLSRSTFVGGTALSLVVRELERYYPVQVDSKENVFACPDQLTLSRSPLPEQSTEIHLSRLFAWHERANVYDSGHNFLSTRSITLAEWDEIWGAGETGSQKGSVRFQGINLTAKIRAKPGELTPEEFRLLPNSSGFQTGPDGRNLGVDVELVGPGRAYHRWRKVSR